MLSERRRRCSRFSVHCFHHDFLASYSGGLNSRPSICFRSSNKFADIPFSLFWNFLKHHTLFSHVFGYAVSYLLLPAASGMTSFSLELSPSFAVPTFRLHFLSSLLHEWACIILEVFWYSVETTLVFALMVVIHSDRWTCLLVTRELQSFTLGLFRCVDCIFHVWTFFAT